MISDKEDTTNLERSSTNDLDLPLLITLTDKTFIIKSIRWGVGQMGIPYAVVSTDLGEYITSGKVLIEQLKDTEKTLQQTGGIKVKLIKRRHYFMLAHPPKKEVES